MDRKDYIAMNVEKLTDGIAFGDYKERIAHCAQLADEMCGMHKLVYGSEHGDMIALASDTYGCFYGKSFTIRTRSSRLDIVADCVSLRVNRTKDGQFADMATEYGKDFYRAHMNEVLATIAGTQNLIKLDNKDFHDAEDISIFISSLVWNDDPKSHKLIDTSFLKSTLRMLKLAGEPAITIARHEDSDVMTLITQYFLITLPMYVINEMSTTTARKTKVWHGEMAVFLGRTPSLSVFYAALERKLNEEEKDGSEKTPNIQLCN